VGFLKLLIKFIPKKICCLQTLKYWQKSRGGTSCEKIKSRLAVSYENIISVENLLDAWKEFLKGKRGKPDVQEFECRLMANILSLHRDLARNDYAHGGYHAFKISDPKPRDIHKASVRDRLLHHTIYRQIYPFFNRTFISDSYSCRKERGTHKAMERFRSFAYTVSKNNTRTTWVLKCDIRKFFASVDQETLMGILSGYIPDQNIVSLIRRVTDSFFVGENGRGLPLGNLTSQLLVNVYMNEFDQFVKHKLKAKHYIRYADDFVFLSDDRASLELLIPRIATFLGERLKLELHSKKVSIGTLNAGVDFLGWVHFFDHRILRSVAKRRMFRRIKEKGGNEKTVQSYLGLLRHGNTCGLRNCIDTRMPL
jgi:RNA-directed DNA polymerase